jgi:hypothetical protein
MFEAVPVYECAHLAVTTHFRNRRHDEVEGVQGLGPSTITTNVHSVARNGLGFVFKKICFTSRNLETLDFTAT